MIHATCTHTVGTAMMMGMVSGFLLGAFVAGLSR